MTLTEYVMEEAATPGIFVSLSMNVYLFYQMLNLDLVPSDMC